MVERKPSLVAYTMLHIKDIIDHKDLPGHDKFKAVESIRMLDLRKTDDFFGVSFLPLNKMPEYTDDGKWQRKNRQEGKIGKTIKTFIKPYEKLWHITINDQMLEEFVNDCKAVLCNKFEYRLVSGEDIRKYYHESSYYQGKQSGTLWSSCMRYDCCQRYFDIYVDQPECEMLIMFDPLSSKTEIVARAIVWNINGQKYVDRRYYIQDFHHIAMIEYIKTQGWGYKVHNTYDDDISMDFYVPSNGEYIAQEVDITVYPKERYNMYPYMDTVKWISEDGKMLTNSGYDSHRTLYTLNDADGNTGAFHELTCEICGHRLDEDDAIYDVDGYAYCCDCAVCDEEGYAIPRDVAVCVYYNANRYADCTYMHENDRCDNYAWFDDCYGGRHIFLDDAIDLSELTEEERNEIEEGCYYISENGRYAIER